MNVFKLSAISFGAEDPTVLWQVKENAVDPGVDVVLSGAGGIETMFAGGISHKPISSFSTPAIARALGVIGVDGASIDQVDLYYEQMEHLGARASGSAHFKVTLYDCLALPRSFFASNGAVGSASFDLIATYDGTDAPMAVAINQALPTAAGASDLELFTAGPASLAGADVDIQSLSYSAGLQEFTSPMNGEYYTRFAGVMSRRASMALTTLDVEWVNTLGVGGASKDNATMYFRGLTNKGTPYLDVSTEHVKLLAVDSLVTPGAIGASAGGQASVTLNVQPVYDGTNACVAASTGAAIT